MKPEIEAAAARRLTSVLVCLSCYSISPMENSKNMMKASNLEDGFRKKKKCEWSSVLKG